MIFLLTIYIVLIYLILSFISYLLVYLIIFVVIFTFEINVINSQNFNTLIIKS